MVLRARDQVWLHPHSWQPVFGGEAIQPRLRDYIFVGLEDEQRFYFNSFSFY